MRVSEVSGISIRLIAVALAAVFAFPFSWPTLDVRGSTLQPSWDQIKTQRHAQPDSYEPNFGSAPRIEKIWKAPTEFRIWGDDYLSPPEIRNGMAFVHAADCQLYAIDLASRSERWHRDANCYPQFPLLTNDTLLFLTDGPYVTAFDQRTGEIVWERSFDHVPRLQVFLDEDILVVGWSGRLSGVEAYTGSTRWSAGVNDLGRIAVSDGIVFIASGATVSGRDTQTGTKIWPTFQTRLDSIRTLSAEHGVLVVTDWQHRFVAIDIEQRAERWSFDTRSLPDSVDAMIEGPAEFGEEHDVFLSPDRAHLYLDEGVTLEYLNPEGSGTRWIQTLDLATGALLWTAPDPLRVTRPVLCGAYLCGLGEDYETLQALDLETGKLAWQIPIEDPYVHGQGITISDDTAYLTNGRDLFLLDFSQPSGTESPPVAVLAITAAP
jgi:outer membrane protein assembly factor BamB